MGRKRDRESADNREHEEDKRLKERKQASSQVPPVDAQPAFHLPTPRPPAAAQSTAVPPQFHLPSPRPPPPSAAPIKPAEPQPHPLPQKSQPTATAPPAKPQPVVPAAPAGKKKRKHRKRKATAAPPQPVDQSLPLPAVPAGHFHVFVGGLPYSTAAEQVRQYFQRDGCYVWEVRLAQYGTESEWAGEGRGFCHVELENEQQVARTLLRNGEVWSDGETKLTVQLAKPKTDRQQAGSAPKASE